MEVPLAGLEDPTFEKMGRRCGEVTEIDILPARDGSGHRIMDVLYGNQGGVRTRVTQERAVEIITSQWQSHNSDATRTLLEMHNNMMIVFLPGESAPIVRGYSLF